MLAKIFPAALFLTVAAQMTPAQAADAACPSGNMTIVRVNTILPTGTMAGFQKAVADHAKWYAGHGYTEDQIIAAPVLTFDTATKSLSKSPDTLMSFHYHSHDVPVEKQDAAWNAYVAEYRANSDIKSTTIVCLPH